MDKIDLNIYKREVTLLTNQLKQLNTFYQDLNDKYCDVVEQNTKLRKRLLNKSTRISLVLTTLDEHEQSNDYSIATDSVRAILTDFDIISNKQGVKGAEAEAEKHTRLTKRVIDAYKKSDFIDPCPHKFDDFKFGMSKCVICGQIDLI